MTSIETLLRDSYAESAPPPPDVASLLDGARRRGRTLHRRRRGVVAVSAAAVIGAIAAGSQLLTTSATPHGADLPATRLPVPAGPQLTVYRFVSATGPARVVSFLDVQNRWCIGTVEAHNVVAKRGDYRCADAGLEPGSTGFGRVASKTDDFTYDGVRQWMQGVATADVKRVTLVLTDGSSRAADAVRDQGGVVFSVRIPSLSTPLFYRAYDASGRLVEQLRVPRSVPHDPFVDWRQTP